jgi:hypothetical protein
MRPIMVLSHSEWIPYVNVYLAMSRRFWLLHRLIKREFGVGAVLNLVVEHLLINLLGKDLVLDFSQRQRWVT